GRRRLRLLAGRPAWVLQDARTAGNAASGAGGTGPPAPGVPAVEPRLSAHDAALHRRVEDADPGTFRRRAGHDAVELPADTPRQETRGRSLPHHPLHLLGAVLLERTFRREYRELVRVVGNGFAGERRAHEALRDEIRIAS